MRPITVAMILASSGRYAIMARIDENDEWTQIESIIDEDNARHYIHALEEDTDRRTEYIMVMKGEDWGSDAPPTDWAVA